jgi:hypothetical protein
VVSEIFYFILPGWILNAAQVVHTYEAFLAAGYVFLFHFFVAHLRPETFPVDPVIFTGRMPLERFKHERPLEYNRLVSSGELEKYFVSPPTPSQTKMAKAFGFTVMVGGALLIIAILKTIFL